MTNSSISLKLSSVRLRLFFTLALMYILVYFYRVSLAVVSTDVSRDLALTPEQLGTLAGVLFYVYAVAQIPLGPLIDRIGSRLVISSCGLITTIGGLLFATAGSLATAMIGRVLIGIGTAAVLMSIFTIFSHWYTRQEFGRITGLMVAAGNLGNLAGTAPLAFAVGLIGWRSSFLWIAVLQGFVTLLIFIKVKDRPEQSVEEASEKHLEKIGMFSAWGIIARDRSFWLLAAIAFCWYGNYLAVQGLWGGPYLMKLIGLSREKAGQMLMWTSVGFIIGSMITDTAARKLFHSYTRTLIAGQFSLAALMTGFLGWLPFLPVCLLPLYFLGIGLTVSTGVMIYPIIRASIPVTIVGTGLTSLNFFVLMGAAIAQHIMGIIIVLYGGYTTAGFRAAFLGPVVGLLLTTFLFMFARNCPAGE